MTLHNAQVHAPAVAAAGAGARVEKIKRPTLQITGSVVEEDQWSFFSQEWRDYKALAGVLVANANVELRKCLPPEVGLLLHKTYGQEVETQNENTLLDNIRKLTVRVRNKLAAAVELNQLRQEPDQPVETFLAKLKILARQSNLKTQCSCDPAREVDFSDMIVMNQLVTGVYDPDIQKELLKKENLTLEQAIKIASDHEAAKRSLEAIKSKDESASSLSAYKKKQREGNGKEDKERKLSICNGCGQEEHGQRNAERKEKCKAYGKVNCPCGAANHWKRVCRLKGIPKEANEVDEKTTDDANAVFIFNVKNQMRLKDHHTVNIVHYDKRNKKWITKAPQKDPLVVSMEVDSKSLLLLTPRYKKDLIKEKFKKHIEEAVPDTGATVTCGGVDLLKKLGIQTEALASTKTVLKAANGQRLSILGVVPVNLCAIRDGKICGEPQRELVHVTKEMSHTLISRDALINLGSIPPSFPYPPQFQSLEEKLNSVSKESLAPCGCPFRESPPSPPNIPYEATEDNVPRLKEFLLKHYGSSTFNTCSHQPLPLLHGPPLEFNLKKDAVPSKVRVPAVIPIHWRKKVKEGIDRDIDLGVLEWVPLNTPETWCHRMVITRKQNGEPRRTVDMQSLNDESLRQTHHTKPPFQQALEIPKDTYKTVLDAFNGYHSVAIAEKDRHLTTFITEWGRLRYRTAPQGYLASGDGYTHRFDLVTQGVKNVHRNIDDSLLHQNSIQEIFTATAEYLTLLGENGILQNADKFQFGEKTVDWSGFRITKDSVKPLPAHAQAIRDFPVPQNITDLRSTYALCNQVAHFFAVSHRLHPMRELLKKGSKWYWDTILDSLFQEMKTVIAREIEKGVTLFDPTLPTALMPDWCKTGIGYIMAQKHCKCEEITPKCCQGGWKVCLVGSRFTNRAEESYSATEGELLAVADSLIKSKYFTLGCEKLIIGTDHKPLLGILNDKSIDNIDNPRLVRLKIKTLAWRFQVMHIPGKNHGGPDCLSRYGLKEGRNLINEVYESHDDISCKEVREHLFSLLLEGKEHSQSVSQIMDEEEHVIASVQRDMKPITWNEICDASKLDSDIIDTIKYLQTGLTGIQNLTEETARLIRLRSHLREKDGALLYKDRPVIPKSLRKRVLEVLHAAHQGITKMTLRAEDSVFWPQITADIRTARLRCSSCDNVAPSQRNLPPVDPVIPEYPFQHICADHLDFAGNSYGIIVDRFSNWFEVYTGKGGSHTFISALRKMIQNFNVPESITTDGGGHYVAAETKNFLEQFGIHHRLTSVGNPHANARAEIGVKSAKRLLRNNIGINGNLDTVKFTRALIVHRNTPNEDTGLSPAEMLIGRKLRGFLPGKQSVNPLKSEKDLSEKWRNIADWRELALAKSSSREQEKWSQGIKELPDLPIGTHVMVQNQLGNHPRRWDKRGVIVETLPYQQYKVRMDGSRRITLRNRKFLKAFIPLSDQVLLHHPAKEMPLPSTEPTSTDIPLPPSPVPSAPTLSPPTPTALTPRMLTPTRPANTPTLNLPESTVPETPRRQTEISPRRIATPEAVKKNLELKGLGDWNKPGKKEGQVLLPKLRSAKFNNEQED